MHGCHAHSYLDHGVIQEICKASIQLCGQEPQGTQANDCACKISTRHASTNLHLHSCKITGIRGS